MSDWRDLTAHGLGLQIAPILWCAAHTHLVSNFSISLIQLNKNELVLLAYSS